MATKSLMVRSDDESKEYLTQAAELRHVSISDYARMVTVEHAKREVLSARPRPISTAINWRCSSCSTCNRLVFRSGLFIVGGPFPFLGIAPVLAGLV